MGRWTRPGPWFVAGLLLLVLGLPTVAGASRVLAIAPAVGYAHPDGNETLVVNLTDAPSFTPRFLTAPAGSNVTIDLYNNGSFNHSFTLARQSKAALNPSWSPAQLDAYFAANGSLANVTLAPATNATVTLSLNGSTGGDSFEFVSIVPYQFKAGMWGFLNVTLSGPPLMLAESTTDTPSFSPDILSASPSAYPVAVEVEITNPGHLGHSFTLAGQSNATLSPANYTQYFEQHPPLANQSIGSGPATANVTFVVTAPGIYEYICEALGHFAEGMAGHLYVGVPVPPAPAPPSTAIVETWVLAGSAILLAIGAVVALTSSLAGRLPRSPGKHGGHP